MATDIVTILSSVINITGLISYTGSIIDAIVLILPSVLTLIVYLVAIGFVIGIIAVILGFITGVLDFDRMLTRFSKGKRR